MHLDEEEVQRLMHGELSRSAVTSAREHLAGCDACRRRSSDAEREEAEVHALLGRLDSPAPAVDAETIANRARVRARDSSRAGLSRWAAGLLLAAGIAGAAYAVPGSPLPAWVESVVEWIGGRDGPDSSPVAPAPDGTQGPTPRVAGVAVAPGPSLVILFTAAQAGGQARVSLTNGAEVVVRASSEAATFTSDVGRLVIDDRGSPGTFEIEIPRAAPRVEIRAGGEVVFLKEGARVTTSGSADRQESYLLQLKPSGS